MVVSNVPPQRDLRDDWSNRRRRRNERTPGPKDGEVRTAAAAAIDRQLPEPRVKEGKQEQEQHQPRPKPRESEGPQHPKLRAEPGTSWTEGGRRRRIKGYPRQEAARTTCSYVPNFACEDDASVYEKLMQEVKAAGSPDMRFPGMRTHISSPTTGIDTASGNRSLPFSWLTWIGSLSTSRWT